MPNIVQRMTHRQYLVGIVLGAYLLWQPIVSVLLAILGVDLPGLLISSLLAMGLSSVAIIRHKKITFSPRPILASVGIFSFFYLLIWAQQWSIAPQVAAVKAIFFTAAVIVPCVFLTLSSTLRFWATTDDNRPPSDTYFISVGGGFLIYFLLYMVFAMPSQSGGTRLLLPGIENPIWVARYVGVFIIILVYRYLQWPTQKRKALMILFILCASVMLVGTNTRSVFLGLVVTGMYMFHNNLPQLMFRISLVVLVTLVMIFYIDMDFLTRGYYSINARLKFLDFFFASSLKLLVGAGLGSFGMALTGTEIYYYPHNIIIEIWFELGVIAIAIFTALTITALMRSDRSENKALLIFFLISAMFSGDLVGNAPVFYLLTAILTARKVA